MILTYILYCTFFLFLAIQIIVNSNNDDDDDDGRMIPAYIKSKS